MASGSNGDSNQRGQLRGQRGQQPQGGGAPAPRRSPQGDDIDFGAFVSERVRSASERLKGGEQTGQETARPAASETPSPAAPQEPTPLRRQRPSRYWRDSLKETAGEEVDEEPGESSQRFLGSSRGRGSRQRPDYDPSGEDQDGGGNGGDWWRRYVSSDDDGGNQRLILFGIGAVILIALLIFGLTRILGDDGGDDPETDVTPTPTVTTEAEATGTESVFDLSTPEPTESGSGEDPDAGPTETPEIRRGGDNQLDPPGGSGDEEETPGASRQDYESEVARACTGECLIRLTSADTTEVLEKTGNRPSFVGSDVAWVVIDADEAEVLDAEAELELISDDSQTYNLYVVTAPDGAVDPSVSAQYGEVVDEFGSHALIAFDQVPAPITGLVESGHLIHKLMPAPPEEIASLGDREPLDMDDASALMEEVDSGNLERTMTDLMAIGELDDSGLGTRYYALPGNQIAADYLFQELESYGLEVWFEDFVSWDGLLLVNVVAEVPGRDDGETYAVMSHFDSFNNTTSPRQAPGADDNATGMAVNLETARIIAGYELEHPVRFVFVNAEEVGIQGATAWARQANADGANVRGVLNVDSVGSARQGPYVVTNSDDGSSWMQALMTDVNDRYGLGQVLDHMQNDGIIADDNMLREQGIDAIMIARELYGWTPFHHTPDDTMANVSLDSVTAMTHLTLMTTVHLSAG